MIGAQRTLVLQHLQRGGTLTALQALDLYGIGRLAARIEELRRAGHEIVSEMVETDTGKKVARYHLVSKPVPAGAPETPKPVCPGKQCALFDDGFSEAFKARMRWEL
jgi:hypothetical protein